MLTCPLGIILGANLGPCLLKPTKIYKSEIIPELPTEGKHSDDEEEKEEVGPVNKEVIV